MKHTISSAVFFSMVILLCCVISPTGVGAADRGDTDFSSPNTGLKEPVDIIWPYEDEFMYQMEPDGPFNTLDMKSKVESVSYYDTGEDGGSLVEQYMLKGYGMSLTTTATVEFDKHRRIEALNTKHEIEYAQPLMGDDGSGMDITYEPEKGKMYIPMADMEIDVPKDGFFSFTGSDSPGQLALMLSAVDLDGDEPVKVWSFNGGDWILGEPTLGIFRFTRVAITPYEDCSPTTQRWWQNTRDDYDDWQPPDDVRTYILEIEQSKYIYYIEGEGDSHPDLESTIALYPTEGPYAAVYIDDKHRLIRIEQPTGLMSTLAELKNIGGKKPWWGKEK